MNFSYRYTLTKTSGMTLPFVLRCSICFYSLWWVSKHYVMTGVRTGDSLVDFLKKC